MSSFVINLVLCCSFQSVSALNRQCYGDYKALFEGNVPSRRHEDMYAAARDAERQLFRDKKVDTRKTHGFLGKSALFDLEYFDVAMQTLPDMMHITSGVVVKGIDLAACAEHVPEMLNCE
jgi:hypothetical protein